MRKKQIGQMRVLDMHAHLSCLTEEYGSGLSEQEKYKLGIRELSFRRQHGVATFFSSGTPEEWKFMRRCFRLYETVGGLETENAGQRPDMPGVWDVCREKNPGTAASGFLLSYGIHPWYADRYRPEDDPDCLEQCDAVGEIGMDSVWCDVPLKVQARIFSSQLEQAADRNKPVILHTKGQEAEIARMIRDFPGKVCVHWYSGDVRCFEIFLEMGCYFTLGPDLAFACEEKREPASGLYREMLQKIPTDRLFLETDGISAVAWARGEKHLELREIPSVLEKNLEFAADRKQMDAGALSARMQENLREFLSHSQSHPCAGRRPNNSMAGFEIL